MPSRIRLVGASVRTIKDCKLPFDDQLLSSRVKQQLRSSEVHVRGDQWPIFLYAGLTYDADDPWNGLLRNQFLVTVSGHFNSTRLIYIPM
jgi:hypothetical protein